MKKIIFSFTVIAMVISCSSNNSSSDDSPVETDQSATKRTEILTNWADNIIIPSFQNYQLKINSLSAATVTFTANPTEANLNSLRTTWLEAYKAYQHVGFFQMGKAMDLGMYSNTFPVQTGPNAGTGDLSGINENISSGNYSLTAISSADEQGFPALDYMLNGLATNDATILDFYISNANAAGYKQYLSALINRLKTMTDDIVTDWTSNYRNKYISSNGNSVSSSMNVTVNIFVKTYEKDVRSGKVGIPAGLYSNGVTYADKVEAFYKNDISKILLNEAVQTYQDFFNGKSFKNATEGASLKSYLDIINANRSGQKLSLVINDQFTAINSTNNALSSSFSNQITTDNSKMITAFNAMQQNLVYFKLDMMQALNISVDYVDNDGD